MDNRVGRYVTISSLNRAWLRIIVIAVTSSLLFTGCAPVAPAATPTPTAMMETVAASPSPAATITLTPTPTAAPVPTPAPVSVSLPPIPESFIVEDELWSEAAFLRWTDGKLYKSVIFFSDILVGTILYAPMSGYLHVSDIRGEFGSHSEIKIVEAADWSESGPAGRHITFAAQEFELLDTGRKDGQFFVEKGQAFAKVKKSAELFPGTYEQKPELIVSFDIEWADMVDDSILDPKEYAWSAVQIYESEEGN